MKLRSKAGAAAMVVCLALTAAMPAFAAETQGAKTFDVRLEAVEEELEAGEAKFRVSVSGAEGATLAELAFEFSGELAYENVKFSIGQNKPPYDMWVFPTASSANESKKFDLAVMGDTQFSDNQELFVISFKGTAGKKVTLKVSSAKEDTYCKIGNDKIFAAKAVSQTAAASKTGVTSKTATVELTLDKVSAFTTSNDPAFTVIITRDDGFTSSTAVSNKKIAKGGHRVLTSDATAVFKIDKTVSDGRKYTVEVLGVGYIPYKKTGVTFAEPLKITNAEFVPGDVNGDGKISADDKKIVAALLEDANNEEYAGYKDSADFNRNGMVDSFDLDVLADVKEETNNKTETSTDNKTENTPSTDATQESGGGGGGGGKSNTKDTAKETDSSADTLQENTAAPTNGEAFTDLANHTWAKDAIYALKNKGIISGVSDTEFAPANNIRRGDFMLILTRMLGIDNAFTENFADVAEDTYYYNAIGSARAAGIASGDGARFMPENSITRQDLITLAYRAFLSKGYIAETDDLTVLDAFSDKDDVADYAKSAMAAMVKAGIIRGNNAQLNPKGFATRAEVAVMCARMLELMK